MTVNDSLNGEDTRSTCASCLRANLARQTSDATALSDVLRPHRAYDKGFDQVYGKSFPLPIKRFLTASDLEEWERQMAGRMKPATLAVYRATLAAGLRHLICEHGGWVDGDTGEGDIAVGRSVTTAEPEPSSFGQVIEHSIPNSVITESPRVASGQGFKISVAQKSLSLALKHAWVQGAIGPPPVCPVDRIILNEASRITGRPWFGNWTEVNDIDDYDCHVLLLIEAADFRPIATWELLTFEGLKLPRPSLDDYQVVDWENFFETLEMPLRPAFTERELELDQRERIPAAMESFRGRFGVPQGDPQWPNVMLKDALKSSLQHNPTYLPTTPERVKIEVRAAMRRFISDFLQKWSSLSHAEQTFDEFKYEILRFQGEINAQFRPWFR